MPTSEAATLVNPTNNDFLQLVNRDAIIKSINLKDSGKRIIAGHASVSGIVDSQGDVVTHEALVDAWDRWKANPDFCILSLLHSNIPVAKVLFDEVVDGDGVKHLSGIDEQGLYLVAEVRDDITVADDLWGKIERGEFRGFSIGGKNLAPQPKTCDAAGCSRPITNLELHEVAIVDKPANEMSLFNMLKSDDLAKLADATKDLAEQIVLEGAVKISKRPNPATGLYNIVVANGLDASKLFCTKRFAVIEKCAEGEEYVNLFDAALLRPESALAERGEGGGVNPPPPQAETPNTPTQPSGEALEKKEEKEVKAEPSDKDESGKPVTQEDVEKAVWSVAYVNDLPDSSFAYIEPGGEKDGEGKTTPRSKRHLPYKDKDGKVDAAHVRNALARLSQTQISAEAKESAHRKLLAAAKSAGVEAEGGEDKAEKMEKSATPPTEPPKAETPKPAEPPKKEIPIIQAPQAPPQPEPPPKAEPTKAEVKPVEAPKPAPAPAPQPKVEEPEIRGVVQTPAPAPRGFDLASLYKEVSWGDIHEAYEASRKRK